MTSNTKKYISIYIDTNTSRCYCSCGVYIRVSGPEEICCKLHPNTGFKYVRHRIYLPLEILKGYKLEFLIYSDEKKCYDIINLFENGGGDPYTIKCENGYRNVCVYFYEKDPRPLLFCYNDKSYRPIGKLSYSGMWVKEMSISNIKKCECKDTGEDSNCDKLIESLTEVVGFLNRVDLSKHPPVTGGNVVCKNTGSPSEGTPENITCAATDKNVTSCTYVVHEYNNKKVQIKVTCSAVPRNGTTGNCNYKKLTHTPAGMCDARGGANDGEGFRLGNVVYNNKGEKGKIQYYTDNRDNNRSQHWCQPLVKVEAYYYNEDKNYEDPLLVVLEFKNNGERAETDKECYKLTERTGSNMRWEKDTKAESKVEKNGEQLVKHLDGIRYGLKKVLNVEINKQGQYQAMGRVGRDAGNRFTPLPVSNGGKKEVTVAECKNDTCAKLAKHNYKCYQHKISQLVPEVLNKIGGLVFTIPGQDERGSTSDKVIEIKLYEDGTTDGPATDCSKNQNGEQIKQLFYNTCMGDVYVFFYDGSSAGVSNGVDTVPLMLWYAGNYYAPCNRDSYFTRWEQVNGLSGQMPPCEGGDGGEKLVGELDKVNKELNRIELDKSSEARTGIGGGYGLPGGIADSLFKTARVTLKKQDGPKQGPSKPPGSHAYYRVVHRTVNGFTIGAITYNKGKDFATQGVSINGVHIEVKKGGSPPNGNHTSLVKQNKCNTVVAYYSETDKSYQLPQLIVILKTSEVRESTPVTSVTGTGYGYYILSTKTNGSANDVNYEYVWREVTKGPESQVTLKDATDFSLLNSIVILIDKRGNNGTLNTTYNDSQIGEAIESANLKSPGQKVGEINRIKDKTISISDATESTCLKETGFKLITHDISQLVKLKGQLGSALSTVNLIAGLRFLIPTILKDDYTELTLYEEKNNGKPTKFVNVFKYHQKGENKVCVFFYKQDPRPLLFCYGGSAYRPLDKANYFIRWVKDSTILNCGCKQPCEELIKALVDVSNFLNPLNIKRVPSIKDKKTSCCYQVHWFNGKPIRIKVTSVEAKDNFCYNRYIHTPDEGFRLGTIYYGCNCIKLVPESDSNTNNCISSQLVNERPPDKYKSADKVVVFYYKHDNDHKYPMVVAMGTTKGDKTMCNLYYVLIDKANKIYEKKVELKSFDLNDNDVVGKKLDDALFGNSNKLQIILDQRPMPELYCPKEDETKAPVKFKCKTRTNGQPSTPGQVGSPSTDFIPASYKAQLYNSEGAPLPNGSPPKAATKTVKVTPVDCWQLNTYGYKCYKHDLIGVQGIEQIGGLKFFLWDNTEDKGASNSKELCLYKPTSGASSAAGTQGSSCTAAVTSSQPGTPSCADTAPGTPTSTLPYTTCKGNVYVYFYGDDPRPLMLCYDNNAYGPMCVEEYDRQWVCLQDVTGCGVEVRFISYFSCYV